MDAIYTQAGLYDAVLPPYIFDGLDDAVLAGRELDRLVPTPVRAALELGCGTGRITPHVAAHAHRLTCVDANAAMLAEFRNKQLGIEPVCADAAGFLANARAESFDLVTAFWSLNYPLLDCFETTTADQVIARDPAAGNRDAAELLTNLIRVLRPGGRLLIFFFDATSPEQQFVTGIWNRVAPFYGGRGYTLHLLTEHLSNSRGDRSYRHLRGTMVAESVAAAERWFLTGHFKQSPVLTGDRAVREELRAFLTEHQIGDQTGQPASAQPSDQGAGDRAPAPVEPAPDRAAAVPGAPGSVRVPTGLHIITYARAS